MGAADVASSQYPGLVEPFVANSPHLVRRKSTQQGFRSRRNTHCSRRRQYHGRSAVTVCAAVPSSSPESQVVKDEAAVTGEHERMNVPQNNGRSVFSHHGAEQRQ